jgi:hypothetical protein
MPLKNYNPPFHLSFKTTLNADNPCKKEKYGMLKSSPHLFNLVKSSKVGKTSSTILNMSNKISEILKLNVETLISLLDTN